MGELMEELPRLLDSSDSPLERELLREGRRYRPPAGAYAKTAAAVGIGAAGWLSVKAALATPLAHLTPIKGAILVSAVAAGGYYVASVQPAPVQPPVVAPSVVHQPQPPSQRPTAPAVLEVEDLEPEQIAPEPEPPKPVQGKSKRPGKDALREELAALDRARAALLQGSPARALELIGEYDGDHPRGRLRLEAEALRIDALARAGRHSEAKSRAERFVSKYPNSFLANRVRRHLDQ